jgi:hypothetical protein
VLNESESFPEFQSHLGPSSDFVLRARLIAGDTRDDGRVRLVADATSRVHVGA